MQDVMQDVRKLRVKEQITLWNDFAPKGEEVFTLEPGEVYEVLMKGPAGGGWPVVYVNGDEFDMALEVSEEFRDSDEYFWNFWEEI